MTSFRDFQRYVGPLVCFTKEQAYILCPTLGKNALTRWQQAGYITKLRKGLYLFDDYQHTPNVNHYLACKIINPSYISLHSALSFYGMIPEAVTITTSVTTLHKYEIDTDCGRFSYRQVSEHLFFGYKPFVFLQYQSFFIATPEKALIDLLYLYPQYDTIEAISELRLDDDFMQTQFNFARMKQYLIQIDSPTLTQRCQLLTTLYGTI